MNELNSQGEEWVVRVSADTTPLRRGLADAEYMGRRFGAALSTAFEGIAIRGKSLGDVLKSLALNLSSLVLKAALRPLETGFGNLVSGLFSGTLGFAKGGVFANALPVPFASGGVIQSPITFPLGQGRMGIAGERGAEAIMPLARGSDGRLGVVAHGASGASVHVTVNITTPDVDGFRRSEAQVAAMLARAVSYGQRNL